jgi:hypothetical protein
VAFDHARESWRRLTKDYPAGPADSATARDASGARWDRLYEWRAPESVSEPDSTGPLDEAESRRLSAAAGEITRGPSAPSSLLRIESDRVPARLRSWRPFGLCGRLTLSAPAFRGDLAFVETSYGCGGYCGYSSIYALRRSGEGWTIVATALTGVS